MNKTLLLAAVGVTALALSPAAAAAMPSGDYDFNLPGLQPIKVNVEETGLETIKLTAPSGFKVNMAVNRRGTRYEGSATDPHGVKCNNQPMAAKVFYSVQVDGMGGIVEVLGTPCGPGQFISPLIFTMTAPQG